MNDLWTRGLCLKNKYSRDVSGTRTKPSEASGPASCLATPSRIAGARIGLSRGLYHDRSNVQWLWDERA